MKNSILACISFFIFCQVALGQYGSPNLNFWGKVDTKIYGNPSYVPKNLEQVPNTNKSFAVNDNGTMILTFGTLGYDVNQTFLSDDFGKTWLVTVQSRFDETKKYSPYTSIYSYKNKFISENYGNGKEECFIQSTDGKSWSYFCKKDEFSQKPLIIDNDILKDIIIGSPSEIQHKFGEYYGKSIVYNSNGNVSIEGEIENYAWDNSKRAFVKNSSLSSDNVKIGENGKILKHCDGTFYYSSLLYGILISKDNISYTPLITGICEKKYKGGNVGSENHSDPVFFGNNIFIYAWEKNWKENSGTYSVLFSKDGVSWSNVGNTYDPRKIRYNPKNKRFYLFIEDLGLFQSKETFELDCQTITPANNPCALKQNKFDIRISEVPVIPQPNHFTCWAAGAAMMHWWKKKKMNYSISDALYEIESGYGKFYRTFSTSNDIFFLSGGGIECFGSKNPEFVSGNPEELYINLMGLTRYTSIVDLTKFHEILTKNGPILLVRRYGCLDPKNPCHSMIMVGLHSDGTPECTTFDMIDPFAWDVNDKSITVKVEPWSYKKLFECQYDYLFFPTLELAGKWKAISNINSCKKIYCDNEKAWMIGMDDRIYFQSGNEWKEYSGGGTAQDIAVFNNVPYVIGSDGYIYKGTGNGWTKFGGYGSGKSIFCDKGTIWVVGSDDAIYAFKGGSWSQYPGSGQARDIAVNNDVPYVIGMDNAIYKGTGSGWNKVSGKEGKRIFYEGGKIWIIGLDDNIYYHDGKNWILYPGNGTGIDISAYNGVPYVVGTDNAIYKGK